MSSFTYDNLKRMQYELEDIQNGDKPWDNEYFIREWVLSDDILTSSLFDAMSDDAIYESLVNHSFSGRLHEVLDDRNYVGKNCQEEYGHPIDCKFDGNEAERDSHAMLLLLGANVGDWMSNPDFTIRPYSRTQIAEIVRENFDHGIEPDIVAAYVGYQGVHSRTDLKPVLDLVKRAIWLDDIMAPVQRD